MSEYASRTKSVIKVFWILAIWFGLCSTALAGLNEGEVNAYLKLARQIPKNTSFAFMATNVDASLTAFDSILKEYHQTDPSFRYDQVILSMKGALGYNPFDSADMLASGFDFDFGVAAFSLTHEAPPLVIVKAKNTEAVEKVLVTLAMQMGQLVPCPDESFEKMKLRYFSQDGTVNTRPGLGYAIKNNMVYLMAEPGDRESFKRALKNTVGLVKSKSLAADRGLANMLKHQKKCPALISYSNYHEYVKSLKRGTAQIKEELKNQAATPDEQSALMLLDEVSAFADGFDAQIFALTLESDKITFVHELVGPKKKVREFKNMFRGDKGVKRGQLDLSKKVAGYLYGAIDLKAFEDFLTRNRPDIEKSFVDWKKRLQTDGGIDLDADVVNNLNGEMAVLYYGLSPIPAEVAQSNTVTETQMVNLAKLVFAAGVRDSAKAQAVLDRSEKTAISKGTPPETFSIGGVSYRRVNVDGLTMEYGLHGDLFLLGIGNRAIEAALAGPRGLSVVADDSSMGVLHLDFATVIRSMENLKPPADSPNTQLHQQYNIWKQQVAGKLSFFKQLRIVAEPINSGFRTEGVLSY